MVTDLHAKNQVNTCKRLEKSPKLFDRWNFTKSKAHNFAKNRWSVTKLKLDLPVMVIDLYAKKSGQYLQTFRKKVRITDTAD